MKNKSVTNKINTFSKKLKAIRKKGIHEKDEKIKNAFKNLEFDLRNTMDLQDEIQKLKSKVKAKKKELVDRIKKFQKDSKSLKKTKKVKSSLGLGQEKTRVKRPRVQRKNTEMPKPVKYSEVVNVEAKTASKRRGRPPLKAKAAVSPTLEVRKRGRKKASETVKSEPSTKLRAPKKATSKKEVATNSAAPATKKATAAKKTPAAKKVAAPKKASAPKKAAAPKKLAAPKKVAAGKTATPVVRKKRAPKVKLEVPVIPEIVTPANEPDDTAANN